MDHGTNPEQGGPRSLLSQLPIVILMAVAIVPPLARALRLVDWPWGLAFAPFTLVGILFGAVASGMFLGPAMGAVRRFVPGLREEAVALTPAPDHLEPPPGAKEAGEGILVRHPELLAAVCHGLRFRKLMPTVFGQPVSDPWGVYQAALQATPGELEELRVAASLHTRRFARSGIKALRRTPSDSNVLKRAVEVFKTCATKSEVGKASPDCTFEHVTAMFGVRAPSRDDQLRTVAPRVRKLLEKQYPQLSTASLSDGSRVKYADWQKQAARDRRDLAHLRKEHERLSRRMEDTLEELADARAYGDAQRESMDALRIKAREEARAAQEEVVRKLRASFELQLADQTRQVGRLSTENGRLVAALEAMTAERDSLERALFSAAAEHEDEGAAAQPGAGDMAGLRLLLVGGHEGQIPPIREYLESHGAQLLHADGPTATDAVGGAQAVALWVRFVSHSTALAVKRECRVREVPCLYWSRTSPASLGALLAEL